MSIYSTTTESNFNKPILNDELNYQKLQKFNKFYLTNSNFSCKTKTKIETSNKSEGLYNMNAPFSPKNTFLHSNIKNIRSRNYSNNKSLVKYKTYNIKKIIPSFLPIFFFNAKTNSSTVTPNINNKSITI